MKGQNCLFGIQSVCLAAVTLSSLAVSGGVAHAQMVLVEPSSITPGIPLNVLEFKGVDTSRDGFENILLGMPHFDEDDPQIGEVHILSTSNFGDDIIVFGEQPNDMFGFSVVGIPVNPWWEHDGHNVLISAPNWDDGTGAVGRVYLVQGDTGEILHVFQGTEVDSFFGWSIAPIGDITGNDVTDIAVGAPAAGPNNEGRIYLFDGATGHLIDQIDGTSPEGLFGATIASAGDMNGDWIPEILIGAPGNHDGQEEIGRVYVYDGATRALIREINGPVSNGRFGASIDGGADVNGDGMPNIVIGAPGVRNWKPLRQPNAVPYPEYNTPGTGTGHALPKTPQQLHSVGRAYVFSTATVMNPPLGEPLMTASADLTLLPSVEGDLDYGMRVEIGNDVTLDGLANIIISAGLPFEPTYDWYSILRHYINRGTDGSEVTNYTTEDDVEDVSQYLDFGDCPPCPPHCPLCPALMEDCKSALAHCANPEELCGCIAGVTWAYNKKMRSQRRWSIGKKAGCSLVCIVAYVFTSPVLGTPACIGCLGWGLTSDYNRYGNIRDDFIDAWAGCFQTYGGPQCAIPPDPPL